MGLCGHWAVAISPVINAEGRWSAGSLLGHSHQWTGTSHVASIVEEISLQSDAQLRSCPRGAVGGTQLNLSAWTLGITMS